MSECEYCEQLDYAAIIGDARRMERERIIKAFDSYYQHSCNQDFPQREGQICHLCNMHSLIKGKDN